MVAVPCGHCSILWHGVVRGFAIQGVYILVFLGAAWANFATKDIKS